MLGKVFFTCESLVAHFEINEHPTKKTATRFCLPDSYSSAVHSFSLLSFAGSMTHKSFDNPLENNTRVGRTEIAEPVGEQLMRIWNLKSLYLILSTSSNLWFFQISGNCKTQVYHFFHHARPVHVTQVLQATDHRVLVVRDHDHCPFLARLLELEKRPVMIRDRFRKDSRKNTLLVKLQNMRMCQMWLHFYWCWWIATIHTTKGMNFKFPIKIWELPATTPAIPLWIWRFQVNVSFDRWRYYPQINFSQK